MSPALTFDIYADDNWIDIPVVTMATDLGASHLVASTPTYDASEKATTVHHLKFAPMNTCFCFQPFLKRLTDILSAEGE